MGFLRSNFNENHLTAGPWTLPSSASLFRKSKIGFYLYPQNHIDHGSLVIIFSPRSFIMGILF